MSAKHTPGPWIVDPVSDDEGVLWWNVLTADSEIVGGEGIIKNGEANARLIAAAPELLEACQAMINSNGVDRDVWNMIYEAVDKATGKS